MIFRHYTVYKKHEIIKIGSKTIEKNRKYCREYSNNFAAHYTCNKFKIKTWLTNTLHSEAGEILYEF